VPEPTRDQAHGAHLAATAAQREAAYDAGVAAWHERNDETDRSHLQAAAIANCRLCDTDGYTAARRICDHKDHTAAAKRGMAAVRAALAKDTRP
jgi:hypothetical protein